MRGFFKSPRYGREMIQQMDILGFGSLAIILLTGTFTGMVLALNSANTLQKFGVQNVTGQLVATSLIRELGPVLTCLMLAGRVGSGIAAELGSMLVSEQIDAMRALGTDPLRKLVAPRLFACILTLPLLTILADFCGALGGFFISYTTAHLTPEEYWTSVYQALDYTDVTQGLMKPLFFAFIVALVGCYFGLHTSGGTEGVGRATTEAVVVAYVLIVILDFMITKFLIGIHFF